MKSQRERYVAPRLSVLGKLESITSAANCTGMAIKGSGTTADDSTFVLGWWGSADPECN